MRKALIVLIALVMCIAFAVPALAAPIVILDAKQRSFGTIYGDQTLVPLTAIPETLEDTCQTKLLYPETSLYK